WYVNGLAIPNANRSTYVTPVPTTNDNGNVYLVEVSSGGSSVVSLPAYLGAVPGRIPRIQPFLGVNFLAGDPSSVGTSAAGFLNTNDVAGAVSQEYFNNLPTKLPLVDSHGSNTLVTISYGSLFQSATGTGDSDADHALFQGYVQNTNNPI